jgi:Rrp15p
MAPSRAQQQRRRRSQQRVQRHEVENGKRDQERTAREKEIAKLRAARDERHAQGGGTANSGKGRQPQLVRRRKDGEDEEDSDSGEEDSQPLQEQEGAGEDGGFGLPKGFLGNAAADWIQGGENAAAAAEGSVQRERGDDAVETAAAVRGPRGSSDTGANFAAADEFESGSSSSDGDDDDSEGDDSLSSGSEGGSSSDDEGTKQSHGLQLGLGFGAALARVTGAAAEAGADGEAAPSAPVLAAQRQGQKRKALKDKKRARAQRERAKQHRLLREKNHVVPQSVADNHALERSLKQIATQGVVQLFNAVNTNQRELAKQAADEGESDESAEYEEPDGKMSFAKRQKLTKERFMELLQQHSD